MGSSDSKEKTEKREKLLDRLKDSSFPPSAVVGALVSFAGATLGEKSKGAEKTPQTPSFVQIGLPEQKQGTTGSRFEIEYSHVLSLAPVGSKQSFRHSIVAVAVDRADNVYVLGDGEVRIFDFNGNPVRNWKAPDGALCMTVDSGEKVYFGRAGHVEIYRATGIHEGGFAAGESAKPSIITAVKISGHEILVADATARCIRRYTETGKLIGEIGTQNKTRGFMLPNRSLDMDVDANGMVRATDTGRHRVSSWHLDGTPAGYFGKFGLANPEDFVGCCNPVNIAVGPDGKIVTAEKVAARVKIFDGNGKLLALIGPEHFDPKCIHLHLAVDSKGRIIIADPVRLEVKVFSMQKQSRGSEQL